MSKATTPVETFTPTGANMRYQLLDQICVTSGSRLYRARCLDVQGASAVLKLPNAEGAIRLSRFRREYEALHALDIPGVIKPIALIQEAGHLMMALDQVQGESLESVLAQRQLDLPTCLRLASQMVRILAGLHAAHLIHQDWRPANLMVMTGDARLCLLDLSLATPDTQQTATAADTALHDWRYLSPEQTGRLNRPVDYRTDFYSLGMVLYRMLTGQLPFEATDALEWAHCHIARIPRVPAELRSDIPSAVSDIVMKLLAKLPEDRYQSARGLQFDLDACIDRWQATGRIEPFVLGARDIPDRFQIPQKLYGRDEEKAQLFGALERMVANGQPAFLAVSGPEGIGKSTLVHELQKPVVQAHGYFISGKFDQHQRDIPYATIAQAFAALVQQLLSESEVRVRTWRQRIQGAVGVNGQLIADLLPQVGLIIGAQPAVPALAPTEARNRFRHVFLQFIGIFARHEHPLVIFLDDLQWADAASLDLIGELLRANVPHLLLVGAYRDHEVQPAHPLLAMLDEARNRGATVIHVTPRPLPPAQLARLIADTLHHAVEDVAPLAMLIDEKTGGNPFFATQFLANLHEKHLLRFDAKNGDWRWNIERVRTQNFSDNVVDLMLEKLVRLPVRTQTALKQLACFGNTAELSLIANLCGTPEEQTEEALREAVRAGLVTRMDGTYKLLHDRAQEAVYSLIPQTSRAEAHLRIARLLQARLPREPMAEQIFDLANQFNRALPRIAEGREKTALVQLNILAGQKARAAVAYASARAYFAQAAALLGDDSWHRQYEESFQLYLSLAETEYLVGDFASAEVLLNLLLERARSRLDRARTYQLRMKMYQAAGRFAETVEVAVTAMELLGMAMPDDSEADREAQAEFHDIPCSLAGRSAADIVNGPMLDDPEIGMLLTLLIDAAIPAYHARPAIYRLLAAKPVTLSLQHGNHPASAYAYNRHAVRMLSETDDVAVAFEFSEMSIRLNEKFDDRSLKGRLLANHASYILPWRTHLANVLPLLDQAFQACIDVGDISFAGVITNQICWHRIEIGDPLEDVLKGFDKYLAFTQQALSGAMYAGLCLQRQFVAHLQGATAASFDIENFGESFAALPRSGFGPGFSHYQLMKLIADFLDGRYAEALAAAQSVAPNEAQMRNLAFEPPYCFYHALTLCALFDQASSSDRQPFIATLGNLLARLKFRAEHSPDNWLNQYALVAAELARIEGRELDAERFYEEAIRAAGHSGFVNNQALAYELAASFYGKRGFEAIADLYLREARACYRRWGADRKLRQIDKSHPQLGEQPGVASTLEGVGQFDALSVAKASQAISSRIVLDELVDTLMRIVIESAGAQSGALVLVRGEELILAAEANTDRQTVRVHRDQDEPLHEAALPVAILNYVRRSAEQVLLEDAGQRHPFAGDPYFSHRQPKSVLCLPILRQSNLIGLLYLENNLLTRAFTPERLTVLELLSAQAAISLENAVLYTDLQRENAERRRAEEMLTEREARIRRLVESNIISVMFWHVDGRIYEANEAFLRLIGRTREELRAGRIRWPEVFVRDPEADARSAEAFSKAGRVAPYQREIVRTDGSRVPVLTGGTYFEGSQEQGVNFILDLTEQKHAEEALRRAHDELEARVEERTRELRASNEQLACEIAERQHAEAVLAQRSEDLARSNAELEQFAYVASHDLQEPLRMVGSYMQLLRRRYHDKLDESAQEFIEYAVDGAKRMQSLIDDLLTYSRVGTTTRPFVRVDLDAVLRHTLATLDAPIRESGAKIDAQRLPAVTGDAGQLGQLFQNLIGNALKFRGEAPPQVNIDVVPDGDHWRFSVRDNGIGIAPEYKDRIFVMFQRLHTRREYAGTGIGLAICKKIVERHGGHIWVEPNPQGGSVFQFTMPRADPA